MKGPPSYQIGLVRFVQRNRSSNPRVFIPAEAIAFGKHIDAMAAQDAAEKFETIRQFAKRFRQTLAATREVD